MADLKTVAAIESKNDLVHTEHHMQWFTLSIMVNDILPSIRNVPLANVVEKRSYDNDRIIRQSLMDSTSLKIVYVLYTHTQYFMRVTDKEI